MVAPQALMYTEKAAVGFMFLGGPLDHSIRRVPRDEGDPRMPAIQTHLHDPEGLPHRTYHATRCVSGSKVWWCFVLEGYDPPVSHLLDANPFYI